MFVKQLFIILFAPSLLLRIHCQEDCKPTDCIVSEWNNWSECTETCGENGTRLRLKTVFRAASCGGECLDQLAETEPCNIKCCPKDCVYSEWSKWGLCFCDSVGCEGGGERYNCSRTRTKLQEKECGGYCDDVTTQEQCGNLCCYQNCAVSAWSFWGMCQAQCEQTGTKKRIRKIVQEPRCHGKQCGALEEVIQCTGDCCPVDCILGEWSKWTSCNVTCGESVETRVRFVQLPDCKGKACSEDPTERETRPCSSYTNVDCRVSPWTVWSDCVLDNGFCGKGIKSRSRTIERQPECQGLPCLNLTKTGTCYGQCCLQDCVISDWTVWSHCSTSCGQGIRNRTRTILQSPGCGGSPCTEKLLDKKDCVVRDKMDCEFTNWSQWTACSADCGFGVQGRTRTLITPAYCGGKCENEAVEEEKECESYEAKQDCEVSEWSLWGECVQNCARGDQTRNRTVIVNAVCTGTPCLADLVERRDCHLPCEQLCNLGICSCNLGYRLSSDNVTCSEVVCPIPKVSYCPPTHREITDCRQPYFMCADGYKFNKTCTPYCSPSDWTVKGTPLMVTCQNDGTWTQPDIYCSRPNRPPIGIEVDTTIIEENKPTDFCFAYLSTITDGEEYEVHTYMIVHDVTNRFYIRNNRLCLARKTDFEEEPPKWDVTFRSTDIDGEYVEQTIVFEITNANDAPTSVKIEPNSIPENSPPDTVVGCLSASDDDPNQNVTLTLVDSYQEMFGTFVEDGNLCIKVIADSDPRCRTDGGTFCTLNKEVKDTHYITILAMDDGIPPMSAYYDVPIKLTDVNDKQTSIDIEPKQIPEERYAGSPLIQLLTIDEDGNQQYTYKLLDDNSGLFKISGDYLTATRVFDFEKESGEIFEVMVESTDDDSENPLKVSKRLVMQIADINERPYDLQLSSVDGIYQFEVNKPSIVENMPSGVIGTVTVKDDDAFDDIHLHIVNGMNANGRLSLIDRKCSSLATVNVYCSATLMLTGSLNYEVEGQIDLSIEATDTMNAAASLNLSIEVLNVNDPPTKLLFDEKEEESLRIQEFQQHIKICNLSALDEDVDVSHTFELVDSSGGLFVIENGELWTSKDSVIDYEIQTEHTLSVKCIDEGNPPISTMFDIQIIVIDVNEKPTITKLSENKIAENSPDGTFIGELTTIDPDNEVEQRQSFRYSLPEDSKGRFILDGNRLLVKSSSRICGNKPCSLDYEIEPELYVTMLTMDDGYPRQQRLDSFTIEIENANDPPTDIKLTNSVIKENQPPGTIIGLLTAEDQDGGETLVFSLNDHEDLFSIEDGNKMLTKMSLDHEYLRSYRVRVSVTDNGTIPAQTEGMLLIQVLDVNEAPHAVNLNGSVDVQEDVNINTTAATLFISDPDSDDTLNVSIEDLSGTVRVKEPICNTTPATGATDCTIVVITKKALDANKRSMYPIMVTVQDQKGLWSTYSVNINVIDVNNPPTNILINDLDTRTIHVPENVDTTKIVQLQTVDADIGQTFDYNITFDSSGLFQVFENIIKSTEPLDFESEHTNITLVIKATDSGSPPLSTEKRFTLIIDDVNEPPTALKLLQSQVKENSLGGTMIGIFEIEDPDEHGEYDIILINNGLFVVENGSLKVGPEVCVESRDVSCQINFENQETFILTALVKDNGTPPTSAQFEFIVTVLDVNEPPTSIELHGNKVKATAGSGTVVGNITATDDDADQTYTFELLNATGIFSVNMANQLIVKNSALLNNGEVLSVKVKVTDDGNPPASSEDILTVIVMEDSNVTISLSWEGTSQTFPLNNVTVQENVGIGETVGTIIIKDIPEHNRTFDVAISKGGELFGTSETRCTTDETGSECKADLLANSLIDFEQDPLVEIIVQATGDDGKKAFEHYWITILNVNENPTNIEYSESTINVRENTMDEFLGQFYGKDPDSGDLLSFKISGSDSFVLSENGSLFSATNATFDFETRDQIDVVVTVTDHEGLSFNKSFTVYVLDVNEKPSTLNISNNKIQEMAEIGTSVGTLQVADPDIDQLFTFEILGGSNEIFDIDGNILKVVKEGEFCSTYSDDYCLLDFETRATYTLKIRVTDSGNPVESELFELKIVVEDVNDKPGAVQISTKKVHENTPLNSVIANLTVIDRDENQTITFAVEPSDMFYIIDSSIVLNTTLDFESRSSYNLQVQARDDGIPSLSVSSTFILEVIDVNELPMKLTLVHTMDSSTPFPEDAPQIVENLPPSTHIGQVIVNDPDNGEEISLQILSASLMFKKEDCIPLTKGTRCTWDVSSARPFDFEKVNNLTFIVIATDGNGLQMQKNFVLEILDSNDAPMDILLTVDNVTVEEISVLENSLGALLAELSVKDEETDQSYIYDVTDNTKSLYVSGNELRNDKKIKVYSILKVKVTSAARLDHERLQQFSISIKVTDSGFPTQSYLKQFSVLIQDVNEPPKLAYLSNNEIAENSTLGTEVGKIIVQDPDNIKQDVQTFTIAVMDENVPFQIEGDRLVVTKLEFDLSDYTIQINVTDSGTPPLSEQFVIHVHIVDVNDPPTRLDFTGSLIDENTAIGEIIGELQGRDDDTGQELTYNILNSDNFSVNNGAVVVNGLIDYERGREIMFMAMVTDSGNPPLSLERSFSVMVEDVNERPRSLKLIGNDNMTISESTSVDETVGMVEVIDEDETEIFQGDITVGDDLFKLASSGFVCEREVMETSQVPMTVCTNDLLLAVPLDYETMTEPLSVMVTVHDKGDLELKQLFTFRITNENEPPRDMILDTELESIPENSEGIVVGGLSTIDDDRSDSHFYQMITHWETFSIIGNKLFVRTVLDYETQDTYTVTIRTTDNGSPVMSLNKDFVLQVADVNEAPTEIELSHSEVEAGADTGTVVGHITVVDPDNLANTELPQTHECKVSPTELFAVDSGNSVITKNSIPVDMTSYNITITCSDSGIPQLSASQEFQIHMVENVNAPKGIRLTAADGGKVLHVEENGKNVLIGNLSVVNLLTGMPDAGSYTFLVESNTEVDFAILGLTVQLVDAVDYEVMRSIEVKVRADGLGSAGNQLNLEEIFKIEVTDVNEPPTDIRVYGDSKIEENSASGTIVGDLYTIDPEDYQTYTYEILGINFGFEVSNNHTDVLDMFTIDGKTLKVGSNTEALNYEMSDVLTILVQSTDSGDILYSVQSTIHIKIMDINDPPTDITLSNNVVGEDSPAGTIVGTLIVEDEDANQEHKCEILNIIDVPFKVDNNTKVVVDYKLDYESNKSFNIKVSCGDTVPDGTRLKISKTLAVNISNVNEPPIDIHLTVTEIDEGNAIGQVIGEIKATDLDSAKTFISLVQEDDWQMFDIEGDSTLVANVVFDFETKSYHTLRVNVTDDEGATALKHLEIQVKDINEPPVSIVLDQDSVSENKLPGDLIGKFMTSDLDNNQRFSYMLDNETIAEGIFEVDDDSLRVGKMGLDFEKQDLYLISVKSMDDGEPPKSVEVNFTIYIIDANEPPSDIILSLTEAIPEVAPAHTVITTVRVDDPDGEQRHSCRLNDTSHVTLATKEGDVLEMVLLQSLNFEETPALYLEISCTDGEFEIHQAVTIKVSDVNEPPTSIKLSGSQTVRATAEPGHVIGQLIVDDEDTIQTHSFTILGANSDLVEVNENNELVLKAIIPSTQLEQFDPALKFIITIADSGDPVLTYNQTFNIPITNIDIVADELPTVAITDMHLSENSKAGTVIGRLFYVNETSLENMYMSIEDNFENLFEIQNGTYLVLAKDFTTADTNSVFITVKVTDTVNLDFSLSKIAVLVQRTCVDHQEMCKENEKCVVYNSTYSECECQQDFQKNSDGICIEIDNCETGNTTTVPCQNGGTCIDDVNSFVCKCPDGFGGDHCEINKTSANPCSNHHCLNDAICLPNIDTGTYNCSCKTGWEGDYCQSSSDDCSDGLCYNGGQCIDKHLTYLCTCGQQYKGLRCEYDENICIEKHCNDTHLCVGLMLSKDTLCVSEQLHNIDLIYDQPDDIPDIQEFQARFVDFIIEYGRLPTSSSSSIRKRRTAEIKEVQVYVVDVVKLDTGQLRFSLVILDAEGEPFTRDEALSVLSGTCTSINSGDSTEALFCPGIQEAARKPPAVVQASSSAGLIAGIICSFVIVAGITAVAFVIYKKKKMDNAVRPEGVETGIESRRSSGYSSLTRVGRPSSAPRIAKNKVAPEQMSEATASSVSDLDPNCDLDR